MAEQAWVPPEIDIERPNAARIYDYCLGGGHNFAADRALGDQVMTAIPGARDIVRLNFVPDEQHPREIVAAYRDRLSAGSYLALSHFTADSRPEETAAVVELYRRADDQLYPRTRREVTDLFTGFDLVEPGLVSAPLWRPNEPDELGPDAESSEIYAGVGRKQ